MSTQGSLQRGAASQEPALCTVLIFPKGFSPVMPGHSGGSHNAVSPGFPFAEVPSASRIRSLL